MHPHESARETFRGWRGLQAFRASPWDPLENLPPEYARVYEVKRTVVQRGGFGIDFFFRCFFEFLYAVFVTGFAYCLMCDSRSIHRQDFKLYLTKRTLSFFLMLINFLLFSL